MPSSTDLMRVVRQEDAKIRAKAATASVVANGGKVSKRKNKHERQLDDMEQQLSHMTQSEVDLIEAEDMMQRSMALSVRKGAAQMGTVDESNERDDPSSQKSKRSRTVLYTIAALAAIVMVSVGCILGGTVLMGPGHRFENLFSGGTANDVQRSTLIDNRRPPQAELPETYEENVRNLHGPFVGNEVPLLWHIPASGGRSLNEIFGKCLKLVQASDFKDVAEGDYKLNTKNLNIIQTDHGNFINVDTHTLQGLEKAFDHDLIPNDVVGVVSSPMLLEAASLFGRDKTRKGRLFAMFHHPIDRLVTYFYESQSNTSSRHHSSEYAGMTLEQYAYSKEDRPEFNWMTKTLVGFGHELMRSEDIRDIDLEVAKSIIYKKCLILLQQDRLGGWYRLEEWMGWNLNDEQRDCATATMSKEWPSPWAELEQQKYQGPAETLDPDSPIYQQLESRNQWDVKLYEFVVQLYQMRHGLSDELIA